LPKEINEFILSCDNVYIIFLNIVRSFWQ